ncbi:kynurenine--oxoglutarate transaminase 3-like isoform X2 [Convolutriloba macropyga]|uniref:kynurenine--oxoglutarate transaminase 3-like isoform X2 n=1 Tax=Convolutriloba macropyga TaxID=536237 RepID=UPI003F5244D5
MILKRLQSAPYNLCFINNILRLSSTRLINSSACRTNLSSFSGSNKAELKGGSLVTFNRAMSESSDTKLGYKKTFGNPLVVPYLSPSVWTDIVGLTIKYQACNLGQGFPDYPPPEAAKQALLKATENDFLHQYTRGYGHPRLVNAIASLYGQQFGRSIDANSEVMVSTGAYESLYAILVSLLGPGDEAIILEPFFDCYDVMVGMSGAKPVYVPLEPPKSDQKSSSDGLLRANDWKVNMEQLEAAFNEKTKLILINTPNNPLGKVFRREELEAIAALCRKHDVICVSDEVYEWMVYEGQEEGDGSTIEHVRMATLEGMWDRTLTVCSAGKTFNTTGWKLGWTIGPNGLLKYAMGLHQNTVYTNATLLQEAVAAGLEHEQSIMGQKDSYFVWIKEKLKESRDMLTKSLVEVGFEPHLPQGGYFVMAEYSKLPISLSDADPNDDSLMDFKIVRWLIKEKKLTAIPVSAFYSPQHKHIGEKFLRFCFIKNKETLDKAAAILKQWKEEM